MAEPLEIYNVAVPVGESTDLRPFVIVHVSSAGMHGLPLSAQLDCYVRTRDFLIEPSDPDFGKTGLAKKSYVLGIHEFQITPSDLRMRRGELTGDLARRFLEWYGR
ncbi:MAG TPA: hypothetical protein VEK08_05185 [Planctomycetota bacterium]|nr:hypothetical protein [Planctomycetota bacterium]